MALRLARWFAPLTLWTWGGVFVYFYASGRLQSFLHPSFRPSVLATGVALLCTGWLLVFLDRPSATRGPADDCLDGCGRPHLAPTAGGWLKSLVMLLPLVGAVAISPDGFGAAFVRNRSVTPPPALTAAVPAATASDSKSEYLKTDAAGRVKAELVDFRYAAQSPDLRKDMEHKVLEVTGQFVPTPGADRRNFTLTRLFIICCVADAQPLNVLVEAKALPPGLPEMAWIRVAGTVRFEHTDQIVATPIITATKIEAIPAPKEKYLY